MSTFPNSTNPQYFKLWGSAYLTNAKYPCISDFWCTMASWTCSRCGTTWKHPSGPGACVLQGGNIWCDVISSTGSDNVVSEKMRDGLVRLGVSSSVFFPVKILRTSPALEKQPTPNYYFIYTNLRVRLRNLPINGHVNKTCTECAAPVGEFVPDMRVAFESSVPDDWLLFSEIPVASRRVYCTRKVLDMTRDLRLTNCRFDAVETLGLNSSKWNGVDYLGKKWPPDWYPPG